MIPPWSSPHIPSCRNWFPEKSCSLVSPSSNWWFWNRVFPNISRFRWPFVWMIWRLAWAWLGYLAQAVEVTALVLAQPGVAIWAHSDLVMRAHPGSAVVEFLLRTGYVRSPGAHQLDSPCLMATTLWKWKPSFSSTVGLSSALLCDIDYTQRSLRKCVKGRKFKRNSNTNTKMDI